MLVLAHLAILTLAVDVDLPVATQGTEQWAGVVAKAMTVNGRSQAESLQALKFFESSVTHRMAKTVSYTGIVTYLAVALWTCFSSHHVSWPYSPLDQRACSIVSQPTLARLSPITQYHAYTPLPIHVEVPLAPS